MGPDHAAMWLPAAAVGSPLADFAPLLNKTLPGKSLWQEKGPALKALSEMEDPWEFLPWFEERLTPSVSAQMREGEIRDAPEATAKDARIAEFAANIGSALCF